MNISAEYFINNKREKGKLVGRIVCDCGIKYLSVCWLDIWPSGHTDLLSVAREFAFVIGNDMRFYGDI